MLWNPLFRVQGRYLFSASLAGRQCYSLVVPKRIDNHFKQHRDDSKGSVQDPGNRLEYPKSADCELTNTLLRYRASQPGDRWADACAMIGLGPDLWCLTTLQR